MNAEEIRSEAIERVAMTVRVIDLSDRPDLGDPKAVWASLGDERRADYREYAATMVDALGDLLPTGEEISTCFSDEPAADEEAMRRYVGDWKQVTA